jgi:hypothetical protein
VVLERPLGLVETTLGVAVAGVAYPIALGAGKTDLVVERCIAEPARYTFSRGIGELQARPESSCSPVGLGFGLVRASIGLIERPIGMLFGRSPFADDDPTGRDEIEVDHDPTRDAGPDAATI